MNKIVTLIGLNLVLQFPCYASASIDSLMPEFAGRGNLMGRAEVCNLSERHVFKKETMRLIKESGLNATQQASLIQAFNIEYKAGIETTKAAEQYGVKPDCESLKEEVAPLSEEEIKIWKLMILN